jgi:hypothetical protein
MVCFCETTADQLARRFGIDMTVRGESQEMRRDACSGKAAEEFINALIKQLSWRAHAPTTHPDVTDD